MKLNFKVATLLDVDGSSQTVTPDDGTRKFKLPQLQKLVGGYIELLRFDACGCWLVLNDDGKGLGLKFNQAATTVARVNGLPVTDYIAGSALLCPLRMID